MKKFLLLSGISISIILAACFSKEKESSVQRVVEQYRKDLDSLSEIASVFASRVEKGSVEEMQSYFFDLRIAYKQVEWLAEYYQPYTARFINGPALEEVEVEDRAIVIRPEGFQVVEELLFPTPEPDKREELIHEVKLLQANLVRLQRTAEVLNTTDAHIMDALRLQIFRLIALGLSGFDSPIALNTIAEAGAVVMGIEKYLAPYDRLLRSENIALSTEIQGLFRGCKVFLSTQQDFVSLDRMHFITRYLNPLSEKLFEVQQSLSIPFFSEPRPLRADAKNIFAPGIFLPQYYSPDMDDHIPESRITLGYRLFHDTRISSAGRSCASCHQPDKGFTDGMKVNSALHENRLLERNTPTLLNAGLQPALFYDTRMNYLEDQAKDVILNKDEMHGSIESAIKLVRNNPVYGKLYGQAFAGSPPDEAGIKKAISAYVRSLVSLDSRFDKYMRGQIEALDKNEINGFNLFMGKAKCGTCHFVPLFSGNNPPQFLKIDAEVIGVPYSTDTLNPLIDPDKGKFMVHKIDLYQFAFKTPTVRNIALTAPYMHNGVFKTLEEVIDFYNRGGGIGLGLPIETQTLPPDPLNLSAYEQQAIVAFLKSLTDTSSYIRPATR